MDVGLVFGGRLNCGQGRCPRALPGATAAHDVVWLGQQLNLCRDG